MEQFEKDLKEALKRQPAPDWLAGAVMARVGEQRARSARPKSGWFAWSRLRWAAAALAVVAVVGGVRFEQQRREEARGEAAKQELMMAFQLTGTKLHQAREKVLARINPGDGHTESEVSEQ